MTSKNRALLLEHGLFLSWAISLIATLGSLYLSEIMRFPPCDLCWWQRIFMYPLVVILGIATVRKNNAIVAYTLPLSLIGGSISIYHYMKQKLPYYQSKADTCSIIPCNIDYLDWFGFITIPLLALIAFALISIIHIALWKAQK
ncbi:disulfide oxidoreductase [Caldalkalibacillus mannanilyticus]|uniref:disulfide oxidoreductase n=1 Tax=Caldalkalibacillus mannanilyticus TaxID=1418 RepID=UPI00046AE178|nr:disulfide oxidoreductase [Caldalkalibacillus mannanilyticus]